MPALMISSLASAFFLLLPQLVRATCYWQNSTLAPDDPYSIATDDTACFPDQDNSPCCGTGWTCLSDGVCYIEQSGTAFYYRGTCTDRTWDSQQCPGWCFQWNATGSIPLDKCDTSEDWYCCRWDPNCSCNTGKDAIKLAGTQPSTITVIGSTSWPGFTSTTAAFTASPLVSDGTSTNTQTTSSSLSSTSVSTTAASSSASSGTAAGASSTLTGSASSGGGGSSNTGLAAGLGAGLGAAAVLVSILAYFLIRKRRAKNDPTSGTGASYTGTVASNTMQHSSPYAGTQAPSYSSHDHMGSGIQYIKPELAGTGAYDSTQSPTETEGRHRHIGSTHRAELDTS